MLTGDEMKRLLFLQFLFKPHKTLLLYVDIFSEKNVLVHSQDQNLRTYTQT